MILLYYLSQNPDFSESVKPLMSKLKDSEHLLSFLNDLSKFTQTFGAFQGAQEKPPCDTKKEEPCKQNGKDEKEEKKPQSPTSGIADTFIEEILESYFQKR